MLLTKRNRTPLYRLGELFLEAGIISPVILNNSLVVAKRTSMPIGRVLVMSGHVSELDVECAVQAQGCIRDGSVEIEMAKELLRFAHVHQCTIEEAYRLNGISRDLGPLSRLGKLLLAAGIVEEGQLKQGMRYAEQTGYPLGLSLVHLNHISEKTLTTCINLQILLRDKHLNFFDAVKSVQYIVRDGETFEGLLTALGLRGAGIAPPPPKVGELLVAANLVSKEDAMVLAELGTERDMQYGELVTTYNLVKRNVIDAAVQMQKMFSNPMFTMARAARLLNLVHSMDTTLEHILAEFDVLEQAVTMLRAAEVLDEAVLRETAASIKDFEMCVSEALILRQAVTASQARLALMCVHQIQSGTMTYDVALRILGAEKSLELIAA
jgi:hypothetical protein